ncbi:DUF4331 family protein [Flavobacterium sp. GT3R68]|uniref:DUF4331 family protein n=1 Tax=Flavobacterium sp. GT3R68 TaxID=2594437 RepID=UPI002107DE35|nr:DUF4331 family protein [Flavobacterium sp. GT3R68]
MSKTNKFKIITVALLCAMVSVNCDTDDSNEPNVDFSGTYTQKDQMARPAINTVFIASGAPKDAFNLTIPSTMGASYQSTFQTRLLALNPAFTTNALGQTAMDMTTLLATDVLNVAKTGTTTFFDGTNVLTGRALADDVIDVELLLIFGGSDGMANASLTSDNVGANDKAFLPAFPYLAAPF